MDNVHRLIIPRRDETHRTAVPAIAGTGEVLILPCVRYERIDAPGARRAATSHEEMRQDLTA